MEPPRRQGHIGKVQSNGLPLATAVEIAMGCPVSQIVMRLGNDRIYRVHKHRQYSVGGALYLKGDLLIGAEVTVYTLVIGIVKNHGYGGIRAFYRLGQAQFSIQ